MNNQKGFASIYIVIIFASIIAFLLIALEAASGYAASSISEGITAVAGRSVLSEYQPELFGRYGVFMINANGSVLTDFAEYYVSNSLPRKGVVRLDYESVNADSQEYTGLKSEEFKKQIVKLGTMISVKNTLQQTDVFKAFNDYAKNGDNDYKNGQFLSEIEELSTESDAEYDKDGKLIKPESAQSRKRRAQASELRRQYKDATDYYVPSAGESVSVNNIMLPSNLMGVRSVSPILSGGLTELDSDAFFESVYSVYSCSNQVDVRTDTFLKNEAEYIIFGKPKDSDNAACACNNIFTLRFVTNLAEIYANPRKLAEISAVASASFFLIPAPLAIFMLASIDAGINAKSQVALLLQGGFVEFISGKTPSFGYYRDYLVLLMIAQKENVRLAHLMDVMQLNVADMDGASFSFADYAYGFDLKIQYIKPARFTGITGFGSRTKIIEKTFIYK